MGPISKKVFGYLSRPGGFLENLQLPPIKKSSFTPLIDENGKTVTRIGGGNIQTNEVRMTGDLAVGRLSIDDIKIGHSPIVKFKLMTATAKVPKYADDEAVGMDMYCDEDFDLLPLESRLVRTSVKIELPAGYEAQIRPRSGLAAKAKVTVLNSPGTIDPNYRGELFVNLFNASTWTFNAHRGDRIAQMVIVPVVRAVTEVVDELSETSRGESGHGSTGGNKRLVDAIRDELKPQPVAFDGQGGIVPNRTVIKEVDDNRYRPFEFTDMSDTEARNQLKTRETYGTGFPGKVKE
jgi:dUTP pyrophosphatase